MNIDKIKEIIKVNPNSEFKITYQNGDTCIWKEGDCISFLINGVEDFNVVEAVMNTDEVRERKIALQEGDTAHDSKEYFDARPVYERTHIRLFEEGHSRGWNKGYQQATKEREAELIRYQGMIESLLLTVKSRLELHDANLELHEGGDFEESEIRLAESGYTLQLMRTALKEADHG